MLWEDPSHDSWSRRGGWCYDDMGNLEAFIKSTAALRRSLCLQMRWEFVFMIIISLAPVSLPGVSAEYLCLEVPLPQLQEGDDWGGQLHRLLQGVLGQGGYRAGEEACTDLEVNHLVIGWGSDNGSLKGHLFLINKYSYFLVSFLWFIFWIHIAGSTCRGTWVENYNFSIGSLCI